MTKLFIMLVDDEDKFVETTAKRLAKRDIETITAFNGEDGLEKLKANRPLDVIVLDVRMPKLSGIDTLKEIKKMNPLTEVIMLTGHATVESAIEGMKLGAFDYLMKPCDIDLLVNKIKEAAKKKREHERKIEDAQEKRIKDILSIYDS